MNEIFRANKSTIFITVLSGSFIQLKYSPPTLSCLYDYRPQARRSILLATFQTELSLEEI